MRALDWMGLWRPSMPPWEVALRATFVDAFVHLMLRLLGRRELGSYSTPGCPRAARARTSEERSVAAKNAAATRRRNLRRAGRSA